MIKAERDERGEDRRGERGGEESREEERGETKHIRVVLLEKTDDFESMALEQYHDISCYDQINPNRTDKIRENKVRAVSN